MAYRVCGAAAVVEMDDGNADLNTGRKVYLDEGGFVPEGAKPASVDHLRSVGLIEEVDAAAAAEAPKSRRASAKSD